MNNRPWRVKIKKQGTHVTLELALFQGIHMEFIVGVGFVALVEGFVTAGAVPSIVGSATKSAAVRPLRVHEANCCLEKFEKIQKSAFRKFESFIIQKNEP